MEIVFFLVPASLILVLFAFVGYFWAIKSGQFDDLETPALRILTEDAEMDMPLSEKGDVMEGKTKE